MRRFVEGADHGQWTLLPKCLDDFIDESKPVRVVERRETVEHPFGTMKARMGRHTSSLKRFQR
jgi:hypothetical protein